jgi:hypothetical protein
VQIGLEACCYLAAALVTQFCVGLSALEAGITGERLNRNRSTMWGHGDNTGNNKEELLGI